MNTFAALAFTNILQLIAALKNGAVFEIVFKDGTAPYKVTDFHEEADGRLRVHYTTTSGWATSSRDFKANGSHAHGGHCWLRMVKEAPAEPFLKQFVNGTPAYNPKTRETVVSISFVSGAIEVLLRDEAGDERVTTNYDHEGKHRWVKGRSLVLGELPPKPVVMKDVVLYVMPSDLYPGYYYANSSPSSAFEEHIATVTVQVPA